MRWIAPWVLSLMLAIGLTFEWQRARAADERALALQATAAELSNLYMESKADNAKWLTKGLRELRAGDEAEGFKALDVLLATTVRGVDPGGPDGPAIADALAYLAEVGDPFSRRQSSPAPLRSPPNKAMKADVE